MHAVGYSSCSDAILARRPILSRTFLEIKRCTIRRNRPSQSSSSASAASGVNSTQRLGRPMHHHTSCIVSQSPALQPARQGRGSMGFIYSGGPGGKVVGMWLMRKLKPFQIYGVWVLCLQKIIEIDYYVSNQYRFRCISIIDDKS